MSQHDMTVDNGAGVAVRSDINLALKALASQSLGATAPSITYPAQVWADTGTGRLKRRDSTNTSWLDLGPLDTSPLAGFSTQVFSVAQAIGTNHAVPLGQLQALPSAIQSVTASVASNALTMTWAAQPVPFRNTSLVSGAPLIAYPSGTLSITVPSGATLGTANGVSATIMLLLAYNAGTPVLCVVNLSGGLDLSETGLISPTTISSGATSAGVIYSASAVAGGSPYRVIGCAKLTEATAGIWATAPTLVQGGGGQALAAMQSFGYGQSWQNMTASRALGTVYTNTTDKMIMVHFYCNSTAAAYPAANSDTVTFVGTTQNSPGTTLSLLFTVLPGKTYSAVASAGTAVALVWLELR